MMTKLRLLRQRHRGLLLEVPSSMPQQLDHLPEMYFKNGLRQNPAEMLVFWRF